MTEHLEAAEAVLHAYEAAFNSNDAEAMNALFAEECSFVNFGGRLVLGRKQLLLAQSAVFAADGPLAHVRVTYTVRAVVGLADELVLVHAHQQSEGHASGPGDLAAVFTVLLQHSNEGWLIRSGQNTPSGR